MELGYESTAIAAGAHLICMRHEPSMTSECSSRGPVSFLASEFNKPVYARRFPLKTGFSCVPAVETNEIKTDSDGQIKCQLSVNTKLLRQQIDSDLFIV